MSIASLLRENGAVLTMAVPVGAVVWKGKTQ